MGTKTWLCRDDLERARLLDMSRRLRGRFRAGVVLIALAVLGGIPTFGPGPLIPFVISAAVFAAVNVRLEKFRRPEYAAAVNWTVGQLAVTAAVVLAHGPRIYLLSLFVFPMMLGSVLFPPRIVAVGTFLSLMLMTAIAFLAEPGTVLDLPPTLVYPAVCMLCTALWASAARAADSASRDTAVVDQLTGLLNRAALEPRVAELRHQAGGQIAVIAGDIDHFKLVNDSHGHATGDSVLQEVARRLRSELGAFNSAYRIGGEEFVVLLTGGDTAAAAELAERLRSVIREEPMHGCRVTMSFGVAASAPGQEFDYADVFAHADRALYQAKRSGRDQVRAAAAHVPAGGREESGSHSLVAISSADRRPADHRKEPTPRGAASRRPGASVPTQNWLMKDDVERAHMLDVHRRLDKIGHVGNALIILSLVLAGPYFGWWGLPVAAVTGVVFQLIEDNLHRMRRPEFALSAGWVLASAGNAAAFFACHGDMTAALTLLILMNVGFSAVFPARAVIVGGFLQALFIVAVAVFAIGGPIFDDPALLAVPLALLGAITAIGTGVGQSAVEHRNAAVVDRLTGLLNRAALESRVAELAYQVSLTGEQVAVIVGDLDHFKAVNDSHGHAAGDDALREVADVLRANVRPFDSIYRLGGEEIAILLPGLDGDGATEMAERMCEAVRRQEIAGVRLSMSFGVCAGAPREQRDFGELFTRADAALYEAKRAGRDRVGVAAPVAGLAVAAA